MFQRREVRSPSRLISIGAFPFLSYDSLIKNTSCSLLLRVNIGGLTDATKTTSWVMDSCIAICHSLGFPNNSKGSRGRRTGSFGNCLQQLWVQQCSASSHCVWQTRPMYEYIFIYQPRLWQQHLWAVRRLYS